MISDKDITVVQLPEDPERPFDPIIYDAHLRLSTRHMVEPDFLSQISEPTQAIKRINAMLKQQILRKLYGELNKPLHNLLLIAYQSRDADHARVQEIEAVLKDFMV